MKNWKADDWQIRAVREIQAILGNAVERNTGQKYGYFVGVSDAKLADVIEKHRAK